MARLAAYKRSELVLLNSRKELSIEQDINKLNWDQALQYQNVLSSHIKSKKGGPIPVAELGFERGMQQQRFAGGGMTQLEQIPEEP